MPDMSIEPWVRLSKIAPKESTTADQIEAAERYAITADLFAAAADLWEDYAMQIDTATSSTEGERLPVSVTQDGIQVLYGSEGIETQSSRIARQNMYLERAGYFRQKAKYPTLLAHLKEDNPWVGYTCYCGDCDEDGDDWCQPFVDVTPED